MIRAGSRGPVSWPGLGCWCLGCEAGGRPNREIITSSAGLVVGSGNRSFPEREFHLCGRFLGSREECHLFGKANLGLDIN